MNKRILVVNGHPDPRPERFCAALCEAYASGVRAGGNQASRLDIGSLPYTESDEIADAVQAIGDADHLVIIYPLWLDRPPAPLQKLLEASTKRRCGSKPPSADIVVTMTLPAFMQRSRFREDSSKKSAAPLSLPGIDAAEPVFIGSIDALSQAQRLNWLDNMRALGAGNA